MKYVIDFGPLPALPVAGSSGVFPVGRIYCVGRRASARSSRATGSKATSMASAI